MQWSTYHPSSRPSRAGGRIRVSRDPGVPAAVYLHLKSGCTDRRERNSRGEMERRDIFPTENANTIQATGFNMSSRKQCDSRRLRLHLAFLAMGPIHLLRPPASSVLDSPSPPPSCRVPQGPSCALFALSQHLPGQPHLPGFHHRLAA